MEEGSQRLAVARAYAHVYTAHTCMQMYGDKVHTHACMHAEGMFMYGGTAQHTYTCMRACTYSKFPWEACMRIQHIHIQCRPQQLLAYLVYTALRQRAAAVHRVVLCTQLVARLTVRTVFGIPGFSTWGVEVYKNNAVFGIPGFGA